MYLELGKFISLRLLPPVSSYRKHSLIRCLHLRMKQIQKISIKRKKGFRKFMIVLMNFTPAKK